MAASPQSLTICLRAGGPEGPPCGAGFMVADDLLMTCAHVVNSMLGRRQGEKGEPEEWLDVFQAQDAELVAWYPPVEPDEVRQSDMPYDVALLRLREASAPKPVVELVDEPPKVGVHLSCFGFPRDYPNGLDGAADTSGMDDGGWQLFRHNASEQLSVEPGFSGAPLLDPEGRVVAMVVQYDPGRHIGHMIPVIALWRAWPVLARPYLGLESFTEANRRFFAGREHAITRVRDKLETHPLVTLVGPSGSGKSSVVGAGVLPRLREAGRVILKTRPRKAPIESLRTTLSKAFSASGAPRQVREIRDPLCNEGRRGLLDLCEDLAPDRQVVLFIDQFEEIFASAVGENEQRAYLDLLTPGEHEEMGPLRILLTVRSEFQNAMLSRDGFNEPVEQGLCALRPMKPEEISQAVINPAQEVGVTVEPTLLEQIQQEIRPHGQHAPLSGFLPLLSFAMNQLWSQAGSRELTLADWQSRLGGLSGALGNHAEAAFAGLSEADQEIAEILFDLLVEARDDGTTTRMTVLCDSLSEDQRRVVDSFTDARLLTTHLDAEDRATVEIAHETLMQHWERLKQQIEVQRRFLLWRTQVRSRMADWKARDHDPGSLLSGRALDEAEHFESVYDLELPLRCFVADSRAAQTARELWEELFIDAFWRDAVGKIESSSRGVRDFLLSELHAKEARNERISLPLINNPVYFDVIIRAIFSTDAEIRKKYINFTKEKIAKCEKTTTLESIFLIFLNEKVDDFENITDAIRNVDDFELELSAVNGILRGHHKVQSNSKIDDFVLFVGNRTKFPQDLEKLFDQVEFAERKLEDNLYITFAKRIVDAIIENSSGYFFGELRKLLRKFLFCKKRSTIDKIVRYILINIPECEFHFQKHLLASVVSSVFSSIPGKWRAFLTDCIIDIDNFDTDEYDIFSEFLFALSEYNNDVNGNESIIDLLNSIDDQNMDPVLELDFLQYLLVLCKILTSSKNVPNDFSYILKRWLAYSVNIDTKLAAIFFTIAISNKMNESLILNLRNSLIGELYSTHSLNLCMGIAGAIVAIQRKCNIYARNDAISEHISALKITQSPFQCLSLGFIIGDLINMGNKYDKIQEIVSIIKTSDQDIGRFSMFGFCISAISNSSMLNNENLRVVFKKFGDIKKTKIPFFMENICDLVHLYEENDIDSTNFEYNAEELVKKIINVDKDSMTVLTNILVIPVIKNVIPEGFQGKLHSFKLDSIFHLHDDLDGMENFVQIYYSRFDESVILDEIVNIFDAEKEEIEFALPNGNVYEMQISLTYLLSVLSIRNFIEIIEKIPTIKMSDEYMYSLVYNPISTKIRKIDDSYIDTIFDKFIQILSSCSSICRIDIVGDLLTDLIDRVELKKCHSKRKILLLHIVDAKNTKQCAALTHAYARTCLRLHRDDTDKTVAEYIIHALRCPFTVGKATEHLLGAARTCFAPDLAPDAGYWDFVDFVGQRFPEIELRVPD